MWALVYAQDIYSKFSDVHNKKELREIGMEYRKKILEVGSSRPELDSVVDFLGRKPNTKAFFVSQGI
jgi:Zn-dependent oligopeptidase